MEDLDLKELFGNLKVWGIVVVIFGTLATIVLINKFGSKDISINKKVDTKQSLVVLVINNQTKNTKQIQETLNENQVKYEMINKDKERYFDEFLRKVSITEEDIIEPTILIIEDKQVKATLVDIKDLEELKSFLEYNKKS